MLDWKSLLEGVDTGFFFLKSFFSGDSILVCLFFFSEELTPLEFQLAEKKPKCFFFA